MRRISLLLAALLLLGAGGCASPQAQEEVRFAVLAGPSGVGAAKLITDASAGETENRYAVTIAAAPDELTGKLISGDLDIAALPSNLAATLYHKTEGEIRVAAVCGGNVLYLLERQGAAADVSSVADLAGQTVYAMGQGANPEYILNHLLRQNGLEPGRDVEIAFRSADEISALIASGGADLCLLPVPAATALTRGTQAPSVISSEANVPPARVAFDIADAWAEAGNEGAVIMTCIVVREAFALENPGAVKAFLEEYAASVDYTLANAGDAAQMVAQLGIVGNPAVAENAIPQCSLLCVTGEEMRPLLEPYLSVLFAAEPKSVGGALPDDAFYYVP